MTVSNEKEKERVWVWEGEDEKSWEDNQNILHKNIFKNTNKDV